MEYASAQLAHCAGKDDANRKGIEDARVRIWSVSP
jgi:hypothetical protein